jgi:hypothetical protein
VELPELTAALADREARHSERWDEYLACFLAALDEAEGDVARALTLADSAIQEIGD